MGAFDEPARGRKDERHGHVGGVLGHGAGRVGDRDAATQRARDVDVVDAVAEIGDQSHLLAGLGDHGGVDVVGDRRDEDIGLVHSLDDLGLRHRLVVEIEPGVEQFAHAGFDEFREPPRDDHNGFLLGHERPPPRPACALFALASFSNICVHAFKRFTPH